MNINKRLLEKYGKYSIYLINAYSFREYGKNKPPDKEHMQYGDFHRAAIYLDYPEIGRYEIWVSDRLDEAEQNIAIRTQLAVLKALDRGKSKDYAYTQADKLKESLEKRALNAEANAREINQLPLDSILLKLYKKFYSHTLNKTVFVFVVNGKRVREIYDDDFIEGGNGFVYKYIPSNQIWLDNTLDPQDYRPVLVHEYVESSLMHHGMKYDPAHIKATKVEYNYR